MHGMITYGQALGAGLIIFLYYAINHAVFTLYSLCSYRSGPYGKRTCSQPKRQMLKKGMPQEQIDAGMAIQAKMMKPAIMALIGIFGNMFLGLIMSLLVAAFVRKEGNPLIDSTIQ